MARRVCLAVLVVALWMGAPDGGLQAEEPAVRRSGFEEGLQKARDLLGEEECREGLDLVLDLLEEHAEEGYVLARRVELQDLVRNLVFGSEHPTPNPQDVVSGKLLHYVAHSGMIRIRYTPETDDDLQVVAGGLLTFPAPFRGPFTVTVKGEKFPPDPRHSPRIVVGGTKDPKTQRVQFWHVVSGSPMRRKGRRRTWSPAVIVHNDGGEETVVAKRSPAPVRKGRKYKIEVEVGATSISASVNFWPIGTAQKPHDVFGLAGMNAQSWTQMDLEGPIEPSWIQSRIDEVVQTQRAAFGEAYDESRYLPPWLLEARRADPAGSPAVTSRWPADVHASDHAALDAIVALLEKGQVLRAALHVEMLATRGGASSVCAYLRGRVHLGMHRPAAALEQLKACQVEAPGYLPAVLLRGRILLRMDRVREAQAVFESALRERPRAPVAYETAVVGLLRAGRFAEAEKIAQRAMEQGVTSDTLEALSRALVKALNGPSWTRVHEYESANFHVLSDIDPETCRKAAEILEEAHSAYRTRLRRVARDRTQRFKVYLFRGRSGFQAYLRDLGRLAGEVHPQVAGVYSPFLKQLLIWNLPSRERMLRTVRHEGLHQYLDRFLSYVPPWFNEGLAGYYEYGHRVAGKLHFGRARPEYLELLEEAPPVPMKTFLHLSRKEFYAGGRRHYAQAWAFMHMLLHGKTEHHALFEQLLADLESKPAYEALERAFGELDLIELDGMLKTHMEDLAEDAR